MGKRKTEFQKCYEEIALMVIGYDQACDFCAWFIINKCVQQTSAPDHESDRVVLVDILMHRYEVFENYEACAKLFPFKSSFNFSGDVTDTEMEDYIFNTRAVLNYESNVEECAVAMWEYGLIALSPWKPEADDIDSILVVDCLLKYLQDEGRLEECETLLKMRGQVMKYRATGKL